MQLSLRDLSFVMLLALNIDSRAQSDIIPNLSDTAIIRQLMVPLTPDSLTIAIQPGMSYEFMAILRLAIHGHQESRSMARLSLQMASTTNQPTQLGLAHIVMIIHAQSIEELEQHYDEAYAIFEKEQMQNLQLLTKLFAARKYAVIGPNYIKAFRYINEFLEHYAMNDHHWVYAIAWNTLGEINRYIGNYKRALECYKMSANRSLMHGNLNYRSPFINIGTIYKNLNLYDSAFFYYDLALPDETTKNDMYAYILNRKAQVYLLMGHLDSTFVYASKSLSIYESRNSIWGTILALSTMTELQYELKQFGDCIQSGERALKLAFQYNYYPAELLITCDILVKIQEAQKDYEKLYAYQKKYAEIYAQLYGPDLNQLMLNEQVNLEMRNQELVTSILRERQQKTEAKAKTQRVLLYVFFIALGSVTIALILIYRQRNKLKLANRKLTMLNEENDGLINAIVHDLKSPFNNLHALLSLIKLELNDNDKVSDTIQHGFKVLTGGQEMIQQLIGLKAIEQKSHGYKPVTFNVKEFIEDIRVEFDELAKKKSIELKASAEAIDFTTDRVLLVRTIENLVSNAIKFSPKGKQVSIRSWALKKQVHFEIKDQGPGFSPEDLENMYGKFQKLSARPTAGESSHGLGLATVDLLVKEMKGTIQLETSEGNGATFTISIPALNA